MVKRKAQRNRERQSRCWSGVWCWGRRAVAAALLVWGTHWVLGAASMPVRHLTVEGQMQPSTEHAVQRRLADHLGVDLLRLDLKRIKALLESLPWVQQVKLRRVWPDRLAVTVREQQAVARWATIGLLNGQGELFTPEPATIPAGLPMLVGPPGYARDVLQRYRAMRRILQPAALDIVSVEMNERRAWRLRLDNELMIELGRAWPEQRLRRLVRVFSREIGERGREMERVDLRYTNGFAVRWKEPPNTAAAQPARRGDRTGV